jgi:ECM component-binding autotransporter adhesin
MKKIALALVLATSASFASAQLNFGPGALADQSDCDFPESVTGVYAPGCGTASHNFGADAYNAALTSSSTNAFLQSSEELLASAQANLDAILPTDPDYSQYLATRDDAVIVRDLAIEASDMSQAGLEQYTAIDGTVSNAAIAHFTAEQNLGNANIAAADAAQLVSDEQGNVNIAEGNTAAALIARDDALTDYQDASQAYTDANQANPNDPNLPTLLQDLVDGAGDFVAASSDYDTTLAAEAAPNAALLAAEAAETTANSNVGTATEALAASQTLYNGLINNWVENVDSEIDQAQYNLNSSQAAVDAATATVDAAQGTLTGLETTAAEAVTDNVAQQAVVDTAIVAASDAAQATAAATAALAALPNDATPEDLAQVTQALADAQTAQAAADLDLGNQTTALTASALAITTADAAVLVQQGVLTTATDNLAGPQTILNSLTQDLQDANDDKASHAAYAEDTANPAGALLTNITNEEDNAQAVITAVSSNYEATEDNSGRIDTNVADIATNANDIGTNANDIGTNATDIGTNATDIGTNEGNIASNTGRITTNEGNISSNEDRIDTNENDIAANATDIATNANDIGTNEGNITSNTGRITTNEGNITSNTGRITTNEGNIASNTGRITTNEVNIMSNTGRIDGLDTRVDGLSDDLDVVRSGVAAALAVAAMPDFDGEGWGAAIGTGYFDGESAISAGLMFNSDAYKFKFAVGDAGGETTASAGVSWGF